MALTAEQKNHFEEQGYLPFGRVLSDEELSALRRRSEEIARGGSRPRPRTLRPA